MTALATDNFNRANSTGLGASWTQTEGGAETLDVLSNTAHNFSDGNDSSSWNNTVTWPNDQYSQATVTLSGNPADQDGPCVAVRMAAATNTYYRLAWTLGQTHVSIAKKNSGYTLLSQPSATLANGDVLRLEIQSTTLAAVLNGASKGTTTDSALSTGNAGLSYSADASGKSATWDDWEGGNFVSAGLPDGTRHMQPAHTTLIGW